MQESGMVSLELDKVDRVKFLKGLEGFGIPCTGKPISNFTPW